MMTFAETDTNRLPGLLQHQGDEARLEFHEAIPKSLAFFLETILRSIKIVLHTARPTCDFGPRTSIDVYTL
ncbi:MAG: hypothetical protein C0467_31190 [Planctomycetaceae bacterium]|nr:hypothetical protein [Planctomycetaceae bacterium]